MTGVIPNRFTGGQVRSASALMANFDSIAEAAGITNDNTVRRGRKITATEETGTSAYAYLTTADRVQNIKLETDGLIWVLYRAWVKGNSGTCIAKIVLGTAGLNDLVGADLAVAIPGPVWSGDGVYRIIATSADLQNVFGAYSLDLDKPGLKTLSTTAAATAEPTTGSIVGVPIPIEAPAGTYEVGVKFGNTGVGLPTAKNRRLYVWTQAFA